jgi:hypothetical protein
MAGIIDPWPVVGLLVKEGLFMKMAEVVGVAKKRGLNPFGKKKLDLIREIQLAEGNRD